MTDDTVLDTTIPEPAMTTGEVEMLLFALDRSRAQSAWKCGGASWWTCTTSTPRTSAMPTLLREAGDGLVGEDRRRNRGRPDGFRAADRRGRRPDRRRVEGSGGRHGGESADPLAWRASHPVVQGRSLPGLRTAQMWVMRSAATSNANTVTVRPSCWATRPGWPLTVRSMIVMVPAARPARSAR